MHNYPCYNKSTHSYSSVGAKKLKTIQMTLDDELVEEVDGVVKRLGTTRSAFTRKALRRALLEIQIEALEAMQRRGYEKHPVIPGEFDDWELEQVWPD